VGHLPLSSKGMMRHGTSVYWRAYGYCNSHSRVHAWSLLYSIHCLSKSLSWCAVSAVCSRNGISDPSRNPAVALSTRWYLSNPSAPLIGSFLGGTTDVPWLIRPGTTEGGRKAPSMLQKTKDALRGLSWEGVSMELAGLYNNVWGPSYGEKKTFPLPHSSQISSTSSAFF
jgi:hypothetical protein